MGKEAMSDRPTYRIRDWERHFESAESRKIRHRLTWLRLPNKHDGKSYRRLSRQEDAAELFAAWVLTLQVASKCPQRGVLADEDGPLDPEDLADKTGFHPLIFRKLFAFAVLPEIGWMDVDTDAAGISRHPPESPGIRRNPSGQQEIPVIDEKRRDETEDERRGEEIRRDEKADSDSSKSFGPSDSDSVSSDKRDNTRKLWLLKISRLWIGAGDKQARANTTDAENIFDREVWPDELDDTEGAARASESAKLAESPAVRTATNPMAYFKSRLRATTKEAV